MKELFLNYWTLLSDKMFEFSSFYGVDPLIFGLLYAGTIPLLWFSIVWIIRNVRSKQSVVLPIVIAAFCFTSTYIYLFLAGQNVPVWVFGVAVCMIGFSGYNIHKKVSTKLSQPDRNDELHSGKTEYNLR